MGRCEVEMSFVVAAPELVQGAAQDLAGIGSSLAEASAAVAGPTTGVVAAGQDGVSAAIASMFGSFGQEFQAVSSQVQAFHAQFVGAMSAGAGAYASTEAANAGQTLLGGGVLGNIGQTISGVVTGGGAGQLAGQVGQIGAQAVSQSVSGFQAGLAAAQAGGPSGLMNGISAFGATVAGPYQTLVANTVTNLQTLGSAISANPAPFAQQVAANQMGHAQTFATGLGSAVQSLPAQLANLPANIRLGIQGLLSANSGAVPQQFANNQVGYGQTISTSLQNAAADFGTGMQALPASFQTAGQALMAGNVGGAVSSLGAGFKNLFITGFHATKTGSGFLTTTVSIAPTGTLGDLLPIFAVPGQMAQTYTNLMPAGSIPAQMAQHATNLIETVTGTGVVATITPISDPSNPIGVGLGSDAHIGLPLVLGLEALGGPVNGLTALGSSGSAFASAVQTGNASAATAAILDAPAVVANGFLNGHSSLPVLFKPSITLLGTSYELPTTLDVPLDGILVPAAPYPGLVDASSLGALLGIPGLTFNATVSGTPISGLLPGLLYYLPADLAAAIGGPPAPVIAPVPS
jgi:hypothetical protein